MSYGRFGFLIISAPFSLQRNAVYDLTRVHVYHKLSSVFVSATRHNSFTRRFVGNATRNLMRFHRVIYLLYESRARRYRGCSLSTVFILAEYLIEWTLLQISVAILIERYEFKFTFIIYGRILLEVLQLIEIQELANSELISSVCSEDTTVCFPTFTFLLRKGLKSSFDIYCSS